MKSNMFLHQSHMCSYYYSSYLVEQKSNSSLRICFPHVLPCFTQLSTSKVTPSQLFRWNSEACPCGPCGPCGPGEQCSELESRGLRGVQERHSIVEASASAPVEGQPAWFFRRLRGFPSCFWVKSPCPSFLMVKFQVSTEFQRSKMGRSSVLSGPVVPRYLADSPPGTAVHRCWVKTLPGLMVKYGECFWG